MVSKCQASGACRLEGRASIARTQGSSHSGSSLLGETRAQPAPHCLLLYTPRARYVCSREPLARTGREVDFPEGITCPGKPKLAKNSQKKIGFLWEEEFET